VICTIIPLLTRIDLDFYRKAGNLLTVPTRGWMPHNPALILDFVEGFVKAKDKCVAAM